MCEDLEQHEIGGGPYHRKKLLMNCESLNMHVRSNVIIVEKNQNDNTCKA